MEAIPTEYEGVRFRSKSEAIFARCLTLEGKLWEYECPALRVGEWTPDFRVAAREKDTHELIICAIEYKPSLPTDTFLEALANRFDSVRGKEGVRFCFLSYGGIFDTKPKTLAYSLEGQWHDIGMVFFRMLDEAARYRFDLREVAHA